MYRPEHFVSAILSLRPMLVNRVDFEVVNHGEGPEISAWNRDDILQPSQSEIEAVDTDALQPPQSILAQDLMAQFTAADGVKIQAAIGSSVSLWLLWQAMTAQRDPMMSNNARFMQGWSALVSVLGQGRMSEIATALGVPALVV